MVTHYWLQLIARFSQRRVTWCFQKSYTYHSLKGHVDWSYWHGVSGCKHFIMILSDYISYMSTFDVKKKYCTFVSNIIKYSNMIKYNQSFYFSFIMIPSFNIELYTNLFFNNLNIWILQLLNIPLNIFIDIN